MFKMSEFIKSLQVNQAKNPRENRDEKFYKIYDKNREGKKIYRGRTIKEANSDYYLGIQILQPEHMIYALDILIIMKHLLKL